MYGHEGNVALGLDAVGHSTRRHCNGLPPEREHVSEQAKKRVSKRHKAISGMGERVSGMRGIGVKYINFRPAFARNSASSKQFLCSIGNVFFN